MQIYSKRLIYFNFQAIRHGIDLLGSNVPRVMHTAINEF